MNLVTFMLLVDLHMVGFSVQDGLVHPRLPAYAWQAVDRRYDLMGYLLPVALQQAQAEFSPDFVLFGGDIVEDGFGKYGREDLIATRDTIKRLAKMTPYFIYGNHDGPQAQFAELMGPLNYTFDRGKVRFIALNTGSMDWSKEQESSQVALEHLRASLKTAEGRKVIVFTHQWLYPSDVAGYSMANAAAAVRELEAYPGTVAVINGHYHAGKYQEKSGIHYLTGRAFCERPFCYYRYQLTDTELICTEFTLKPSEKRFVPGPEQRLPVRK